MTHKNDELLNLVIKENGDTIFKTEIRNHDQLTTTTVTLEKIISKILSNHGTEAKAFIITLVQDLDLDLKEIEFFNELSKKIFNHKGEIND